MLNGNSPQGAANATLRKRNASSNLQFTNKNKGTALSTAG
jgi:hypothetical protein